MFRWTLGSLFFIVCFFLTGSVVAAITDPAPRFPAYVQNQVLVRLTEAADLAITTGTAPPTIKSVQPPWWQLPWWWLFPADQPKEPTPTDLRATYQQLEEALGISERKSLSRKNVFSDSERTIKMGRMPIDDPKRPTDTTDPLAHVYLLTFTKTGVAEAVRQIQDSGLAIHVQPNYLNQANVIPADPQYAAQWGLTTIKAPDGWEITKGSDGVVVAIIDSGVDYQHEDLALNIWEGTVEGQTTHGWDFQDEDADPMDQLGHGTMVAGIIAAVGNNNLGIAGLNWHKTKIMAVRVGDKEATSANLSLGIRFAADNGARVMNISMGSADPRCNTAVGMPGDAITIDVISYAVRQKNVSVIVSAGNDAANAACYNYSNHPDVLSASAIGLDDKPYTDFNYGPAVWKTSKIVAAPGVGVVTTSLGNSYKSVNGTSFSSPHVAGVAALLLAIDPNLSSFAIRQRIVATAQAIEGADFTVDQLNPLIPNDDGRRTYGNRLDMLRALTNAVVTPTPTVPGESIPTPTLADQPTLTPPENLPTPTLIAPLNGDTQSVNWVYEGSGRCWSAWAKDSCSLLSHEGGVSQASRDFDRDGREDIRCSQGDGTSRTTTITNIGTGSFLVGCERYSCAACVTGNGTHAQCDGFIDLSSGRIVDTVTLTPNCSLSCTAAGITGACDGAPLSTPTPTTQPGTTPTPTPNSGTTPTPTILPEPTVPPSTGGVLPIMIDAFHYQPTYSDSAPTYVYAKAVDSATGGSTQRIEEELALLEQTSGNVVKIVMVSTLSTTRLILDQYTDRMRAMGVTYLGINTEPTTGTPGDRSDPSTELGGIFRTDSNNTVTLFADMVQQKGFKSLFGPIRADATRIARDPAILRAMIGNNCLLDGVAFQEQKQIEGQDAATRIAAVQSDAASYRAVACGNFHISVQLMSTRCGVYPWDKCKQFYNGIVPIVNSLAIWANRNGTDATNLPQFVQRMREQ